MEANDEMTSEEDGLVAHTRSTAARLAANERWGRLNSPGARADATASARSAFMARFEDEVRSAGVTDPREIALGAERLRRAHFARLARKSADARRLKVSA